VDHGWIFDFYERNKREKRFCFGLGRCFGLFGFWFLVWFLVFGFGLFQ
jgi:hypothetical protein